MPNTNLDERVSRLEETVRRLEAQVGSLAPRPGPAPPGTRGATRPRTHRTRIPEQLKDARYWFRILGIGLLLLGAAFIFKYSEDEGRSIMALRVAIGVAMGLGLVTIGYLFRHSERHFASVLAGGGIGIWYISGFAAFQIFDLVPAVPAFAFMSAVTILAFLFAVRHNVVALSVVGVLGGLGTPWLLYQTDRALAGPIVYMCLVLAGALGVYLKKGWKALLWSSALMGGGAFIAIGARYYVDKGLPDERLTMQAGFAFYWVLFAAAAIAREVRARVAAGGEPEPRHRSKVGDTEIFVTLIAIYGVGMTTATWDPNFAIGGWVGVASSALYALAWRALGKRQELATFAQAHLLAALILITTGISVLLDGHVMVVTLGAEAAALHVLSRRLHGSLLPAWAHIVYFVVATVTLAHILFDSQTGTPIFNSNSLGHAWIILSGAGVSWAMRSSRERLTYRYGAHGLLLLWILRELHGLPNGQGIVSIIWGAYAVGLVVAGLRIPSTKLRVVGIVTLVITVLKLVAVDLEDVKAVWRVLLFSGFGTVLLFLSHWSQRFGGRKEPEDQPPNV